MRRSFFVRHAPCPKCGSKDNLGLYSDGSGYCFGCGYVLRANISSLLGVQQADSSNEQLNGILHHEQRLQRLSTELGQLIHTEWLGIYGITGPECLKHGVKEDARGRTCFVFKDAEGSDVLIQARNNTQDKKNPKYITYGKPEDVIPIYYVGSPERRSDWLVLVEDCISAIKVARLSDSMPVLGSDLSLRKLSRLKGLYGRFKVWLDGDMYHKSIRMAQRLQMMGCEAQAIYSELDPKCYNDEEISEFIFPGSSN